MAYEVGSQTCVFLDRLGAAGASCVDLTGGMAAYGEVLTPDAVPYAVGMASADVGTVMLGLVLRTGDRVFRDQRRVSLVSDPDVAARFFMVPLVKGQRITEVEPSP